MSSTKNITGPGPRTGTSFGPGTGTGTIWYPGLGPGPGPRTRSWTCSGTGTKSGTKTMTSNKQQNALKLHWQYSFIENHNKKWSKLSLVLALWLVLQYEYLNQQATGPYRDWDRDWDQKTNRTGIGTNHRDQKWPGRSWSRDVLWLHWPDLSQHHLARSCSKLLF